MGYWMQKRKEEELDVSGALVMHSTGYSKKKIQGHRARDL
jgi:hypothetical protein